jgi:hypothetical protein
MNCDNVIEALVMLADGSIVCASERCNADLFWALRGGTGNNFGVLLQATYQLHYPGPLWGFGVSWPLGPNGENADRAVAAFETLQNGVTGDATPKGVGHQSGLNFAGEVPGLFIRGIVAGTPEDGKRTIAALLRLGGDFDIDKVARYAELSDSLESTPALQIATHTRTVAHSRFIERKLSGDEWAEFVRFFVRSPNSGNFSHLESYGGTIRSIDPAATAFCHRRARSNVFTWMFWQTEAEEQATLAFLQEFRRVLAPLSNGHACQNYPNRDSFDYRWMYWGENYPRLAAIKQKYDADCLFRFGQTVSAPADSGEQSLVPAGTRDIDKPICRRPTYRRHTWWCEFEKSSTFGFHCRRRAQESIFLRSLGRSEHDLLIPLHAHHCDAVVLSLIERFGQRAQPELAVVGPPLAPRRRDGARASNVGQRPRTRSKIDPNRA